MIELQANLRIEEKRKDFYDLRLGQCFIMVEPHASWGKLKGQVMIKLAANRAQLLDDGNVRFTIDRVCGPVCVVNIYPSIAVDVLEKL